MVNCETCYMRDKCRINHSGKCLPDLSDVIGQYDPYNDRYKDFKWYERKTRMVKVDLIVGGFQSARRDEYDKNWKPFNPDQRWIQLYDPITRRGYINKDSEVGFPVDLVEFEGKYYVESDGYRRVSISKLLGISRIKAYVAKIEKKERCKHSLP